MRLGFGGLPFAVVEVGRADGLAGLWDVVVGEVGSGRSSFAVLRTVDGVVLFADLGRALRPSWSRGVVAGKVGGWMRSLTHRFMVDAAVVCLPWKGSRVLLLQGYGGEGRAGVIRVGEVWGVPARGLGAFGTGEHVVGVGKYLSLGQMAEYLLVAGDERYLARAKARRVLALYSWRVSVAVGAVSLGSVALAEGAGRAQGVVVLPWGGGLVVVDVAQLGAKGPGELEVMLAELVSVVGCDQAAVALVRGGLVDVVEQSPIAHEAATYRVLSRGELGERTGFHGRNPLSFLAVRERFSLSGS